MTVTRLDVRFFQARRKTMTPDEIATALGNGKTGEELLAAYLATMERINAYRKRTFVPENRLTLGYGHPKTMVIPPEVLADREKRYAITPRDLSAARLGDPLPGYSALERRVERVRVTLPVWVRHVDQRSL